MGSLSLDLTPSHRGMDLALAQAEKAFFAGEVPVGAVILRQGVLLVSRHNQVEALKDPTAHAELLAIRDACRQLGSKSLEGCFLYVTLEPCPLCTTALSYARIERVYFGAFNPKGGAMDHGPRLLDDSPLYQPQWYGGINEQECQRILHAFFVDKR